MHPLEKLGAASRDKVIGNLEEIHWLTVSDQKRPSTVIYVACIPLNKQVIIVTSTYGVEDLYT